eukprot:13035547-Ditylum_brightwellii.AAC.1
MAPSGEPATNIGNANERGSEAAPTTEDMAPSGDPATDMCRVRGRGLNTVTSTDIVQSNGGGNIAGLGVYTDCNEEHLSTSKCPA